MTDSAPDRVIRPFANYFSARDYDTESVAVLITPDYPHTRSGLSVS
jgi:hypothetical protein